jgi:hypothetical protein
MFLELELTAWLRSKRLLKPSKATLAYVSAPLAYIDGV